MAKGISIHIGLNNVDPGYYGGWDGKLVACEADAKDMRALAKGKGFNTNLLLTKDATSDNVIKALSDVALELSTGDILFLTYSGHGGQVPEIGGSGDEEDAKDETWVLYDRELIDDELYSLWSKFQAGVRILVFSDSCHSGTVTKRIRELRAIGETTIAQDYYGAIIPEVRRIPLEVEKQTYETHKEFYKQIQRAHAAGDRVVLGASVLLISGCEDDQVSSDGEKNGLFTGTLLKVWGKGKFKGSYGRFYKEIVKQMPLWQHPKLSLVGDSHLGIHFKAQQPFTIDPVK